MLGAHLCLAVASLMLGTSFPSRLQPITRSHAQHVLTVWSNDAHGSNRAYYMKSIETLYTRDTSFLVGFFASQRDASPSVIAMVDGSQVNSTLCSMVLCGIFAGPSKHAHGIELLRILSGFKNLSFEKTMDERWRLEYMWMMRP